MRLKKHRPELMRTTGNRIRSLGLRIVRLGICGTVLLLLVPGCGKKAPPVAPQTRPLSAVTDLKGTLDKGHVRLTWTHSPDNQYAKAYVVLRAQRGLSQPGCKDCPKVFQILLEKYILQYLKSLFRIP